MKQLENKGSIFDRDVEAIYRFHLGGQDNYLYFNCKMEAEAVETMEAS